MTTRTGRGRHARRRWGLEHCTPHVHRVLREALRIREVGPEEYADVAARGTDSADFTADVVAAGR